VPAESFALKLQAYFRTLFDERAEEQQVRALAAGVQNGNGAVVVFPRGDIETQRARDVLQQEQALQLYEHDLDKQVLEHAASADSAPAITNVVDAVKSTTGSTAT